MRQPDNDSFGKRSERAPRPTRLRVPCWKSPGVEVVHRHRVVLQQRLRLLRDVLDRVERIKLRQLQLQRLDLHHNTRTFRSSESISFLLPTTDRSRSRIE